MIRSSIMSAFTYASNTFPTELPSISPFQKQPDCVLCEMAYRRRPGFQLGRRFLSQGFLVDPTLMHLIEVKGSPAPGRMH
jgi:hypothetical protein